jgi:hypothetical protein
MSESSPEQSNPNEARRGPSKGAKLAASLAAMVSSFTGVSEAPAPPPSEPAAAATVPGASLEAQGPIQTETKTYNDGDSEQYAREFAADPAAGVLTDATSPEANAAAVAQQLSGEHIESITVQGEASAEDNPALPDAGVTTASPDNAALAAKRAELFTPQLQAALAEAGVAAPEIAQANAVEDTWSPVEIQQATALSEQFGYQNFSEMIQFYNNAPDQVPPDVKQFLDQTLQEHRDVKVIVVADHQQGLHAIGVRRPAEPAPTHHHETPAAEVNNPVGYIPEQAVPAAAERPPWQRDYDPADGRSTAPNKTSNTTQARAQKQPLPDNYNPSNGLTRAKSQSMSRRGRGKG